MLLGHGNIECICDQIRDAPTSCLRVCNLFDLCRPNDEARNCLVTSIVKECAWGELLFFLMNCEPKERLDAVRLFHAIDDMDNLSSSEFEATCNPLVEVRVPINPKSDSDCPDTREVDIQGLLLTPALDCAGKVVQFSHPKSPLALQMTQSVLAVATST